MHRPRDRGRQGGGDLGEHTDPESVHSRRSRIFGDHAGQDYAASDVHRRRIRRRTLRQQRYVEDALLVSKAVGKPVMVIWTREDDVKDGTFRNAAAQCLRAGFDEDGKPGGLAPSRRRSEKSSST